MLTKKEHTELIGGFVQWNNARKKDIRVRIEGSSAGPAYCSLEEAREIHAELTELFAILDEKV